MTLNRKPRSAFLSIFVVFVVCVVAFANGLAAHPPRTTETQEEVSVAGHLGLQGMAVKQIFLQQRGNKSYLFLRRADENAFAIVNVSDPAKPYIIDRGALREPATADVDLPAPGSALAITFVPDRKSAPTSSAGAVSAVSLPTETVRLIDLSDPQRPKTIKVFNKVTSVASDDGRKLVFLTNNEGLWIVSLHRNRPLPMCTSESEIEPLPDCQ